MAIRLRVNGTPRPMSPAAARMFFILFGLFGAVFFVVGIKSWVEGEASKTWPKTDGQIVLSEVRSRHSAKKGTTYSAHVEYSYRVAGVDYTSSRIAVMSSSSSNRSSARRTVDRYAPGTAVRVAYDVTEPGQAFLEPGVKAGVFLFIILGGIFVCIGLWGFLNVTLFGAGGTPTVPAETLPAQGGDEPPRDVLSDLGRDTITGS